MNASTRIRLALAQPLIASIRSFRFPRGKRFLMRNALAPILPPPPASIPLERPGGSRVRLEYRSFIGMSALIHGGFEDDECRLLLDLAVPGTYAFDVGANVGIHAIPLARKVAPGRVIAVEPLPENARQLRANASLNALRNVDVFLAAAGPEHGSVEITLTDDSAFALTGAIDEQKKARGRLNVPQTTLDRLWEEAGRPAVSIIKVDVEGAEVGVLQGAGRLLDAERPAILAAANDAAATRRLEEALALHGYRRRAVATIRPWNHLFEAE